MNGKENSTHFGNGAMSMSRRGFTAGLAALSGSAIVYPFTATAASAPQMAQLVDQHRAAKAKSDEINARYAALAEATTLPECRVVTGVDYFTKQPCRWARFEREIDEQVAELCGIVFGPAATAARIAWGEQKKVELRTIVAERSRIQSETGLAALIDEVDAIDNAEFEAWEALMKAKPADMADCAIRASYLLSITKDVEQPRLAQWLEEFLTSLIPAEVSHAA